MAVAVWKATGLVYPARRIVLTLPVILIAAALVMAHRAYIATPWSHASPLVMADSVFSIVLTAALVLLSWAIGRRALLAIGVPFVRFGEEAVFSSGLGLAMCSYATFALALLHLLYPVVVASLAILAAALVRSDLKVIGSRVGMLVREVTTSRATVSSLVRRLSRSRLVVIAGAVFGMMALVETLLPPTAYDALWYHLEAPRLFVTAHQFLVLPNLAQANFPLSVEMLYAIFLLFGSDVAPALLSFATAMLTIGAVWLFALRFFDWRVALIACAALLTASEVQQRATMPYNDVPLMAFTFLALYAVCVWLENRDRRWLLLGAALGGFALATKLTAAGMILLLALLIVTADGWRPMFAVKRWREGALWLLVAGAVVAPWLVKNLVAFHDPFYPLLAGPMPNPFVQPAVGSSAVITSPAPPSLAAILLAPFRLLTMGDELTLTGRGLLDYLAIPLSLYTRGDLEMFAQPSLLFLLAPLAFLYRATGRFQRRLLVALAILAGGGLAIWSLGIQELRYLLPVFPVLAILAGCGADGIIGAAWRYRSSATILVGGVIGVALLGSLAEYPLYLAAQRPLGVLIGTESRLTYLEQQVNTLSADLFLQRTLRPGERVLVIGEPRAYYMTAPLEMDWNRGYWVQLFGGSLSSAQVYHLLTARHIDYLLVTDYALPLMVQGSTSEAARLSAAFAAFTSQYAVEVDAPRNDVYVYRLRALPPDRAP